MVYLVFGEQELLVNKMIDKLAKSELEVIDDFNFVVFDACKTPLYEIVNDAATLPFMAEKKVVVVKNSYFLTNENPKLEFEQSFNELEEYLDNENSGTTMIFSVISSNSTAGTNRRSSILQCEARSCSQIMMSSSTSLSR